MDRFPKKIIIGGAFVLGFTLAMGWGGFTMMIKGHVKKEARIINGTSTYRAWKSLDIPIYLSVYIFNITNSDELGNGAMPKVTEIGPYVYFEDLEKVEIEINNTNEDVTYRQMHNYFFQPEMSVGTEDDTITIPNVPFIGTIQMFHNKPNSTINLKAADEALSEMGEKLTVTKSVREILFDGWTLPAYDDVWKDIKIQDEDDMLRFPLILTNGFWGVLMNKNVSDDGIWTIHNARNRSEEFGIVKEWNGETELSWWKGDSCNKLNGTDGTMYRPFLTESSVIYIYLPDMCRSVRLDRTENVMISGIEAYRYHPAANTFDGYIKNPDNWCFCPHENKKECEKNGFMHLSPCSQGIPLLVSHPHFLGADDEVINGVEGLKPEQELHSTFVDLHPMTGLTLKVAKRMQFGIELIPYESAPSFSGVKRAVIPILWTQEEAEARPKHLFILQIIATLQNVWDMLRYGLVGIGAVLMIVAAGLIFSRKGQQQDQVVLVK